MIGQRELNWNHAIEGEDYGEAAKIAKQAEIDQLSPLNLTPDMQKLLGDMAAFYGQDVADVNLRVRRLQARLGTSEDQAGQ